LALAVQPVPELAVLQVALLACMASAVAVFFPRQAEQTRLEVPVREATRPVLVSPEHLGKETLAALGFLAQAVVVAGRVLPVARALVRRVVLAVLA
jgi:hypothetical protein